MAVGYQPVPTGLHSIAIARQVVMTLAIMRLTHRAVHDGAVVPMKPYSCHLCSWTMAVIAAMRALGFYFAMMTTPTTAFASSRDS